MQKCAFWGGRGVKLRFLRGGQKRGQKRAFFAASHTHSAYLTPQFLPKYIVFRCALFWKKAFFRPPVHTSIFWRVFRAPRGSPFSENVFRNVRRTYTPRRVDCGASAILRASIGRVLVASGSFFDVVLGMRTRRAGRKPSDAGFLRIPSGIMHSEESRKSSNIDKNAWAPGISTCVVQLSGINRNEGTRQHSAVGGSGCDAYGDV